MDSNNAARSAITELDLYAWQGISGGYISAGRNPAQGWHIRVCAHCVLTDQTVNREGRGHTLSEAMNNLLLEMTDILSHPGLQRVKEALASKNK